MTYSAIQDLLQRQRPGFSLEQPFYVSPQLFELEWKHIWERYWLFAGTTAQIQKPGDFFTYALQNNSIIIIRGNDGQVFAHYNTCTHRGSIICLKDKGNAPKLVCPYHQWVFDKDGSLLNARLMPDDFCKPDYHLHPVRVEVIAGLIFISLSDNPPDISKVSTDFNAFLNPFRIADAKIAYTTHYELRTNWKLIAENFRECYHCGPAHPEYCSAVVGANLREDTGEITAQQQSIWKSKGLFTDTIELTDNSFHYGIRYPLRPGVVSYSLDGKAISVPMGTHTDHDAGVVGLLSYPNFWMDAVSDYIWTMRLTPVSASQTNLELTWLVDAKAVEGKDYTLDRLTEFWKITGEQDWKLCENNFRGIENNCYQPGPYAPVENEVAGFVNWCVERLKEGLSEEVTV